MSVDAAIEAIEELGGVDLQDSPDQLHDTVRKLHRVLEAAQGTYSKLGEKAAETNIHPNVVDALHEAAGRLGSTASDLEEKTSGGVTHR
jgi:hypothetical protein